LFIFLRIKYQNITAAMKYSVYNTINKDIDTVISKFTEPNGATRWMEGLQRIEHLSGTPGEKGAKSNCCFVHKGKEMKISEEILEQNLPQHIKFAYQSGMGYNTVEIRFEAMADGGVKQINNSYFQFKGIMKWFAPLMKGMFKKQSLKFCNAFKDYVETGKTVND
jgi:hypothetical protein